MLWGNKRPSQLARGQRIINNNSSSTRGRSTQRVLPPFPFLEVVEVPAKLSEHANVVHGVYVVGDAVGSERGSAFVVDRAAAQDFPHEGLVRSARHLVVVPAPTTDAEKTSSP